MSLLFAESGEEMLFFRAFYPKNERTLSEKVSLLGKAHQGKKIS
jgi:hypothetical protein